MPKKSNKQAHRRLKFENRHDFVIFASETARKPKVGMLENSDTIILIGMPGVGKTTLGRAVARHLGIPFIDLDTEVEQLVGLTVTEIFAQYGEQYFRETEQKALRSLPDKTIVAAGGGTPCYADNMQQMMRRGRVVHLIADRDRVIDRIIDADGTRPMFNALSRTEISSKLDALWQKRQRYYTLAQHSFNTTHLDSIPELEAAIKAFINQFLSQ